MFSRLFSNKFIRKVLRKISPAEITIKEAFEKYNITDHKL